MFYISNDYVLFKKNIEAILWPAMWLKSFDTGASDLINPNPLGGRPITRILGEAVGLLTGAWRVTKKGVIRGLGQFLHGIDVELL